MEKRIWFFLQRIRRRFLLIGDFSAIIILSKQMIIWSLSVKLQLIGKLLIPALWVSVIAALLPFEIFEQWWTDSNIECIWFIWTDRNTACSHLPAVKVSSQIAGHIWNFVTVKIISRIESYVPVLCRLNTSVAGEWMCQFIIILQFFDIEIAISHCQSIAEWETPRHVHLHITVLIKISCVFFFGSEQSSCLLICTSFFGRPVDIRVLICCSFIWRRIIIILFLVFIFIFASTEEFLQCFIGYCIRETDASSAQSSKTFSCFPSWNIYTIRRLCNFIISISICIERTAELQCVAVWKFNTQTDASLQRNESAAML